MTGPRDRSWRPNPDVVAERVDEIIVLIHLRTNRIYHLSPTGARVWELLPEAADEEGIRERLSKEFDVDDGTLERETASLFSRLASADLVVEGARPVGGSD